MQGPEGQVSLRAGHLHAPARQQLRFKQAFCSLRGTSATSGDRNTLDGASNAASRAAPVRVSPSEALSRRSALLGLATATVMCPPVVPTADALEQQQSTQGDPLASNLYSGVDYSVPGPLTAALLPRLEHTCTRCFPACLGKRCMLSLDVVYPKDGKAHGMLPPYPLAVISSGFLTSASSYLSYARRLATWGYTVVMYDKVESATEPLDDRLCVDLIREIIDWAKADPIVSQLADTNTTYLCGHSRGGKVSALVAVVDPRVKAVCLLDPVDVTVYTPQGPDFPSAVAAVRHMSRGVPLAVIGSGRAGDCVPKDSNYRRYFNACQGPAWEVVLGSAGHFQFLDEQSMLQRAVCAVGPVEDQSVRKIAQTVMVAWGEIMVKGRSLSGWASASGVPSDGDLIASALGESEAARQAVLAAQDSIERDTSRVELTARIKNF